MDRAGLPARTDLLTALSSPPASTWGAVSAHSAAVAALVLGVAAGPVSTPPTPKRAPCPTGTGRKPVLIVGRTTVLVAVDGRPAGLIALAARPGPAAPGTHRVPGRWADRSQPADQRHGS